MSLLGGYVQVVVQWFWSKMSGGLLHKCFTRIWFYPSLLRLSLLEGPRKRWYDRIDSTVVLGAIPFRSQVKSLVEDENVRAVISLNEAFELRYVSPSKQEWSIARVQQLWFKTLDFNPPSLEDVRQGVDFIQDYKNKGDCVYVHCKAGRGRSATMAACYLIKERGITPTEAVTYLKSKRPQVKINPRQFKVVNNFYEELLAKKKM